MIYWTNQHFCLVYAIILFISFVNIYMFVFIYIYIIFIQFFRYVSVSNWFTRYLFYCRNWKLVTYIIIYIYLSSYYIMMILLNSETDVCTSNYHYNYICIVSTYAQPFTAQSDIFCSFSQNFVFNLRKDHQKIISMSVASMSR